MSLAMPKGIPRGYAYGLPQIKTDTIFFRAGDETWEFPAFEVLGHNGKRIARYDGIAYVAKIKDLRKKEKEDGLRRKRQH